MGIGLDTTKEILSVGTKGGSKVIPEKRVIKGEGVLSLNCTGFNLRLV